MFDRFRHSEVLREGKELLGPNGGLVGKYKDPVLPKGGSNLIGFRNFKLLARVEVLYAGAEGAREGKYLDHGPSSFSNDVFACGAGQPPPRMTVSTCHAAGTEFMHTATAASAT